MQAPALDVNALAADWLRAALAGRLQSPARLSQQHRVPLGIAALLSGSERVL
jgi:hypothetical protein